MKKLVALLLVAVVIFSLSSTAFASEEEYPTIYVTGIQTNNIYSDEGNLIYPVSVDIMGTLIPKIVPALDELAVGLMTKNYDEYIKILHEDMTPIFADVVLDKNGEASDGSHPEYHSSTVAVSDKKSGYDMWDYRFWYDWRLSPLTSAEELRNYIDRVIEATGKDKVQLVGRCYGANVIQTYITLYKEHTLENVSDIAYYASSVNGIDFMSALFSGEVTIEEQALTNFAEYYLKDEDVLNNDAVSLLAYSLVELFNQIKILGIGTDAVEVFFNEVKGVFIPEVLPLFVGTWPSQWAMINPELYEKAIDFIFEGKKDEYSELIKKTDYYHYNVQLKAEETIKELEGKGINFYIFTKYGFPDMPIYEGAANESDSYTAVPKQSFGAECSDYGEVFSQKYIDSLEDKTYLSPDFKINAATCLIPERSWFIKNLHHNEFAVLHDMTLEIMRYDMTVDNHKYPQYICHDNAVLTPMEGPDEDYGKAPVHPLASLMRFLTAFFNFFAKLFKGEINFSGLLG